MGRLEKSSKYYLKSKKKYAKLYKKIKYQTNKSNYKGQHNICKNLLESWVYGESLAETWQYCYHLLAVSLKIVLQFK